MQIVISDLELMVTIGITDREKASPQKLLCTLSLDMTEPKACMTDQIEDTVDYEKISNLVKDVSKGERNTLEKLAEDITHAILNKNDVKGVIVTLKKFALPDTAHCSVTLMRLRDKA
jgi:dihydroneopterin aldolase